MTTQEILQSYMYKLVRELDALGLETKIDTNLMYIAGGCIRSVVRTKQPKDIDVFFKEGADLLEIRKAFEKVTKAFITDNAITLTIDGDKYQLITTCKGDPSIIVGEFDFTMNMNYFDFETKKLYIKDLSSINFKKLIINLNCRNKLGTLARISKFTERGYSLPNTMNLLELGVQLTKETPIKDFEMLQEESKLYFSETSYNNLSVVPNRVPFIKVCRNYKGSAI